MRALAIGYWLFWYAVECAESRKVDNKKAIAYIAMRRTERRARHEAIEHEEKLKRINVHLQPQQPMAIVYERASGAFIKHQSFAKMRCRFGTRRRRNDAHP